MGISLTTRQNAACTDNLFLSFLSYAENDQHVFILDRFGNACRTDHFQIIIAQRTGIAALHVADDARQARILLESLPVKRLKQLAFHDASSLRLLIQ